MEHDPNDKFCWICHTSESERPSTEWRDPCKCRGSTRWVHHSCLLRFIKERRRYSQIAVGCLVKCPICGHFFQLLYPPRGFFHRSAECINYWTNMLSPLLGGIYLMLKIFFGACSLGVCAFLQVYGYTNGMKIISESNMLSLMLLPLIPAALILIELTPWENSVLRIIMLFYNGSRNIKDWVRRLSGAAEFPDIPLLGAVLILPTVSAIFGYVCFGFIEHSVLRAIAGGCLFIIMRACFNCYLEITRAAYRETVRTLNDL